MPVLPHSQMGPTVLGIIVVISGYLKSEVVAKRALRNEILNDLHIVTWPNDAVYTKVKLKALARTVRFLSDIVAPALIILGIIVLLRLLAESALDLPTSGPQYQKLVLALMPYCDCLAFAALTVAFVGFGYMHFRSRSTENLISLLRDEATATTSRLQSVPDEARATVSVKASDRASR